ncbi:TetR/AcrR family transcriptional regulator [Nocardioides gansuensis]|uniref:TetR/AcrR family transcriptional regulator n=1 Tax=Nocardioides gansuensis TaxID=2138300 RepID=A0A2T8F893_9ACTN|nr:TetR/AcrR family transcriptional regulator [Nocardioides gansuensis]PVG81925.1 TetR/AcrR family transcriptional regulator [Nocardioides gansuensis]
MAKDPQRRTEWTEAATDYVLDHGLIGLSLRPLAAELGTSDRMLLYHFGSKDELVAAVLRASNDRAVAQLAALPPSPDLRSAVGDLWAAVQAEPGDRCTRIYVEAAALGLFGREPYASVVREANAVWTTALVTHLVRSGVDRALAARAADVVDAAFMGFQLDLPLDVDPAARARAVADLADAVAALA